MRIAKAKGIRPIFLSKKINEKDNWESERKLELINSDSQAHKITKVEEDGDILRSIWIKLDFIQNQAILRPSSDADTPKSWSSERSK